MNEYIFFLEKNKLYKKIMGVLLKKKSFYVQLLNLIIWKSYAHTYKLFSHLIPTKQPGYRWENDFYLGFLQLKIAKLLIERDLSRREEGWSIGISPLG